MTLPGAEGAGSDQKETEVANLRAKPEFLAKKRLSHHPRARRAKAKPKTNKERDLSAVLENRPLTPRRDPD